MEGECGEQHAAEEASHEEDEYACVDHPPSIAGIHLPYQLSNSTKGPRTKADTRL
jgi:hypothetical protein